jgi:hypothetical protein
MSNATITVNASDPCATADVYRQRRAALAVQVLRDDPAPRPSRRGGVLIAAYDADRRRRGGRKGRGA